MIFMFMMETKFKLKIKLKTAADIVLKLCETSKQEQL